MPTPQQRITLNPDPPVAGQTLEICYDFSGLGLDKMRLRVTFDPDVVSPAEYSVTPDHPCVTILVPEGAQSITVEDLDGPSPDKNAPIE